MEVGEMDSPVWVPDSSATKCMHCHRSEFIKLSHYLFSGDKTQMEVGEMDIPLWVPDSSATKCMHCHRSEFISCLIICFQGVKHRWK